MQFIAQSCFQDHNVFTLCGNEKQKRALCYFPRTTHMSVPCTRPRDKNKLAKHVQKLMLCQNTRKYLQASQLLKVKGKFDFFMLNLIREVHPFPELFQIPKLLHFQ